jgi:hypothetical protein
VPIINELSRKQRLSPLKLPEPKLCGVSASMRKTISSLAKEALRQAYEFTDILLAFMVP